MSEAALRDLGTTSGLSELWLGWGRDGQRICGAGKRGGILGAILAFQLALAPATEHPKPQGLTLTQLT